MKKIFSITILLLSLNCFSQNSKCDGWGVVTFSENYRHSSFVKWNDSCIQVEKFEKNFSGVWVEISKCEYYFFNRAECGQYDGKEHKKIPCCGHIHTTWVLTPKRTCILAIDSLYKNDGNK